MAVVQTSGLEVDENLVLTLDGKADVRAGSAGSPVPAVTTTSQMSYPGPAPWLDGGGWLRIASTG